MRFADYIVVLVIAVWLAVAMGVIIYRWKKGKRGCCGSCESCNGCCDLKKQNK